MAPLTVRLTNWQWKRQQAAEGGKDTKEGPGGAADPAKDGKTDSQPESKPDSTPAPKPDPKPEASKPDEPKPDAPKSDAPKPDAPKPDGSKNDPEPEPDVPKSDAPTPPTKDPRPTRGPGPIQLPVDPETPLPAPDTPANGPAQDPSPTQPPAPPTPQPSPPVASPPPANPPQNDPPKSDPPKADPPKNDPPKADPPKADPPKNDPPKNEPPKTEPPKSAPANPAPPQSNPSASAPDAQNSQPQPQQPDQTSADPAAQVPTASNGDLSNQAATSPVVAINASSSAAPAPTADASNTAAPTITTPEAAGVPVQTVIGGGEPAVITTSVTSTFVTSSGSQVFTITSAFPTTTTVTGAGPGPNGALGTSPKSSNHTGAIVGGILGACIGLGFLVMVFLYFRRHRMRGRDIEVDFQPAASSADWWASRGAAPRMANAGSFAPITLKTPIPPPQNVRRQQTRAPSPPVSAPSLVIPQAAENPFQDPEPIRDPSWLIQITPPTASSEHPSLPNPFIGPEESSRWSDTQSSRAPSTRADSMGSFSTAGRYDSSRNSGVSWESGTSNGTNRVGRAM